MYDTYLLTFFGERRLLYRLRHTCWLWSLSLDRQACYKPLTSTGGVFTQIFNGHGETTDRIRKSPDKPHVGYDKIGENRIDTCTPIEGEKHECVFCLSRFWWVCVHWNAVEQSNFQKKLGVWPTKRFVVHLYSSFDMHVAPLDLALGQTNCTKNPNFGTLGP